MKVATRNTLILILLVGVSLLMYIRYYHPSTSGFGGFEGFESAPTFTMYYADWCPHCKTLKPVFKDWSKKGSTVVDGKTVFLEMVEVDTNPEKVKGKPVKGYPTLLLEKNGKFTEFDGDRTPAGWESWLSKHL
jgi:thiol-disulfide isomerase/thioredoxin